MISRRSFFGKFLGAVGLGCLAEEKPKLIVEPDPPVADEVKHFEVTDFTEAGITVVIRYEKKADGTMIRMKEHGK